MREEKLSPGKATFVLSCAHFLTIGGWAVAINALMFTNPLALVPIAVLFIGGMFFGYAMGKDI